MKTKPNARAYASDASSVVPGVDQSNRARAKALVVKPLSPLSASSPLLVVVDLFERRVEVVHAEEAEPRARPRPGTPSPAGRRRRRRGAHVLCAVRRRPCRRSRRAAASSVGRRCAACRSSPRGSAPRRQGSPCLRRGEGDGADACALDCLSVRGDSGRSCHAREARGAAASSKDSAVPISTLASARRRSRSSFSARGRGRSRARCRAIPGRRPLRRRPRHRARHRPRHRASECRRERKKRGRDAVTSYKRLLSGFMIFSGRTNACRTAVPASRVVGSSSAFPAAIARPTLRIACELHRKSPRWIRGSRDTLSPPVPARRLRRDRQRIQTNGWQHSM